MSKNKLVISVIIAVALVIVIGVVIFVTAGDPAVDVSDVTSVHAIGKNSETKETVSISVASDDADRIIAIFQVKVKTVCRDTAPYDVEDRALLLMGADGDYLFCLASKEIGTSNVLCYDDSTYFTLNDEEWETVNNIYKKYAG